MTRDRSIVTIGYRMFNPANAVEYLHLNKDVKILYDAKNDSCKIAIKTQGHDIEIPRQGGHAPEHVVIIIDTLVAFFEDFDNQKLASELLQAFSRFMIGRRKVP